MYDNESKQGIYNHFNFDRVASGGFSCKSDNSSEDRFLLKISVENPGILVEKDGLK